MDVLAFCVLLLVLAAFVAAPLYRPRAARRPQDGDAQTTAHEDAVARELGDLDIDRASGLVDEPTYALERRRLEAEATAPDRPGRPPSD